VTFKLLYKSVSISTHFFLLSSIEKEQADNAQKVKDSQEACQRVLELQRKLDHAREVVSV